MQISDVAKKCNVSVATVSRVLNGSDNVAEKTRRKVLAAIEELNYSPNQMGRSLRTQKSGMVLVLVSDLGNSFFSDILFGMDEVSKKNNYRMLVVSTYFDAARELEMLGLLDKKMVDGAILLATNLTKTDVDRYDGNFPLIQCCDYVEDATASHISINNYAAAHQAVQYFINTGHRRIAYIGFTNDFISTQLRELAYRQTLIENGIEPDSNYIKKGTHSFDFGVTAMKELLKLEERPTAVFATSDKVAAGCLRTLANENVSVPEEIAIVGFDNTDVSRVVTPPLSTISQPMKQLGCTAMEMLMDRINGVAIQKEVFLEHEMILRKTT